MLLFRAQSDWLYSVPWGLRKLLGYIKDNYGNPPVMITENGMSETGEDLQDQDRIAFYNDYINNVLKGKGATTQSPRGGGGGVFFK